MTRNICRQALGSSALWVITALALANNVGADTFTGRPPAFQLTDPVYQGIKNVSSQIDGLCPNCDAIVGLGRSPSAITEYMRQTQPGRTVIDLPISQVSFPPVENYNPADYVNATHPKYAPLDPATAEANLFDSWSQALNGVDLNGKNVAVVDYTNLVGLSAESGAAYLEKFLDQNGQNANIQVIALKDTPRELPLDPAVTVNGHGMTMTTIYLTGDNRPLGEALNGEAFDNVAAYEKFDPRGGSPARTNPNNNLLVSALQNKIANDRSSIRLPWRTTPWPGTDFPHIGVGLLFSTESPTRPKAA